jgi:acetolactate synthase-1/2/3 large subunit
MKLSDYISEFLVDRGLHDVFLLPGGGCMHLVDSVGKRPELNYVCCLHEQACAFAAEAYGEYTNSFGCALVTAGPGATNAITGAACAWIEASPCLFLSGQAKRIDLICSQPQPVRSMGQQELDIVAMVRPITKYAVLVLDPREIRFHLEKALWLATTGRKGPVWLDIPLDVQSAQIDPATLHGFDPPVMPQPNFSAVIADLLASLANARRPAIYAGNGVRTAGMVDVFREIVELLEIPILLSWKAADFLASDHPAYIGRPGGIGQRAANFTQQKADWVLVLGARLDLPSVAFNHAGFAPKAHKIFVDIDPAELAKFRAPPQIAVLGDLTEFMPALVAAVRDIRIPGRNSPSTGPFFPDWSLWLSKCRAWVERFPVVLPEYRQQLEGVVSTYEMIDVLSQITDSHDVFVPGSSGPCSDIFFQAFRVKAGQRILNAPGLGAMGTGLPGSIGACIASGNRRVINVNGDGGFQLNVQELETVRRLNLPIKFFILDNDGYRSIVSMQRAHFQGRIVAGDSGSRLSLPDMHKVGAAYEIPVFSVSSHERLKSIMEQTLASPGPAICIVKTSVNEVTAPRATSELLPDGTIVSKPMEDMAPLLDRAEFAAIMAE